MYPTFSVEIYHIMTTNERKEALEGYFRAAVSLGLAHNKSKFADLIGVNRSVLSSAMNGDERYLTENLIEKARKAIEEIPEGEGEQIMVIPTEALAGSLVEFSAGVTEFECERMISPIRGVDMAIRIFGDSMSPEYPSGSLLLIKRVNASVFIEWGKVYVLDTENGAVIKIVRKTNDPKVVECVSLNPSYQPFQINTQHIRGWYRILMVMSQK